MWLPCYRTISKPSLSSARTASLPETRDTFGIDGNLRRCHQWLPGPSQRKLFQVKFGRLAQVADSFRDRIALRGRSGLEIEGDESTFVCGNQDSCESQAGILRLTALSSTRKTQHGSAGFAVGR